ncbi:Glycine N-acyltransferase-like protein 3, partial [Spheniscus magellanicus]
MLILTCPGQLQRLEEALRRSLPFSLPVTGTPGTPLLPPPPHPAGDGDPGDLCSLPSILPEHRDPGDFYANQLTVYYRDEGAWRALLGGTEAVGWTRAFQMQGMQEGMYEAVREAADAKGLRLE